MRIVRWRATAKVSRGGLFGCRRSEQRQQCDYCSDVCDRLGAADKQRRRKLRLRQNNRSIPPLHPPHEQFGSIDANESSRSGTWSITLGASRQARVNDRHSCWYNADAFLTSNDFGYYFHGAQTVRSLLLAFPNTYQPNRGPEGGRVDKKMPKGKQGSGSFSPAPGAKPALTITRRCGNASCRQTGLMGTFRS